MNGSALGFDLLAKLPAEGNVFFSPESIAVALAMTALGARGATREAFERVLHGPADRGRATLRPTAQDGVSLHVANRIFIQTGLDVLAPFRDALAKHHGAPLEALDFRAAAEAARLAINAFVARETADKVRDLLAPGTITPAERLVLVNAIHFKALWEEPFLEHATREEPFHVTPTTTVKAKLMQKWERLPLADDGRWQLLAIPYRGERFEALFALPKSGTLAERAKELSAEKVAKLRGSAKIERVHAQIPRFELEWGGELSQVLCALGLEIAFDVARADFTGMARGPEPFVIGLVIHRAVVALDEKGTEAAAATAVATRAGGMPPPPVPFRADRPFLFAIRDVTTGGLPFLGRVEDPTRKS